MSTWKAYALSRRICGDALDLKPVMMARNVRVSGFRLNLNNIFAGQQFVEMVLVAAGEQTDMSRPPNSATQRLMSEKLTKLACLNVAFIAHMLLVKDRQEKVNTPHCSFTLLPPS
jgi:hypothetical protein